MELDKESHVSQREYEPVAATTSWGSKVIPTSSEATSASSEATATPVSESSVSIPPTSSAKPTSTSTETTSETTSTTATRTRTASASATPIRRGGLDRFGTATKATTQATWFPPAYSASALDIDHDTLPHDV